MADLSEAAVKLVHLTTNRLCRGWQRLDDPLQLNLDQLLGEVEDAQAIPVQFGALSQLYIRRDALGLQLPRLRQRQRLIVLLLLSVAHGENELSPQLHCVHCNSDLLCEAALFVLIDLRHAEQRPPAFWVELLRELQAGARGKVDHG
eukprot:5260666-Prymnesium_polylepis.1